MDSTLLWFAVAVIALVLSLNLWLTFRLFLALKYIRLKQEVPEPRQVGETTPVFNATRLSDATDIPMAQYAEYAKVYVYLSTECSKCKGKLPELADTIESVGNEGVKMWIVSNESQRRVKDFLNSALLWRSAMLVEDSMYTQLNPLRASPYYQFVDNQNVLQAQGMIGDDNWMRFREQLKHAS